MNKAYGTFSISVVNDGAEGEQGYSLVAYVTQTNLTEANWNVYGTTGHIETWPDTASIRNGCRVGDMFAIIGTATDTGRSHELIYRSTTNTGNLRGKCVAHTYAEKGDNGVGVDKAEIYYYLSSSNVSPTGGSWSASPQAYVDGYYYWTKVVTTYTNNTTEESDPVIDQALTDANKKAYDAFQNSTAALTAANGKNSIYHQQNAPTGGTYSVGDLWFDTNDGYKIYKWNGQTWEAEQLGSNAIATGAIVASNIDSGAITADKIAANAITSAKLATDAIKSTNYVASSDQSSHYSAFGTFLDLTNGNIYTPNFGIDNTNGNAYFNGVINATSGRIGYADAANYWEIGSKLDYNAQESAAMIGHGTSYIQSGNWMISNDRINTQSYDANNRITYIHANNTYYDFGLKTPTIGGGEPSEYWLYQRYNVGSIPALESDWTYPFAVGYDGTIYLNGSSIYDIFASKTDVGSDYLPKTGGTISGNLTVNGTITGHFNNSITINNKSYNGASAVDVGTIGVGYGGTGKTSWTQYGIVYASAASTLGQIALGTAGQILKSNGSSNAPQWIDQDDIQVTKVNGHTVESDVPSDAVFTDTTYSNATTSANGLMSSTDKTKVDNTNVYHGKCETSAGTGAKVVTLTNSTGFSLKAGAIVGVKFTYSNTYSSTTASPVTLNVNGTGAKNIWYNTTHSGAGNTGTNQVAYGVANRTTYYMYDGTYWVWLSSSVDLNDNTVPTAYCPTGAGTAAKVATCTNYVLTTNTYIHVLFTAANSVAGAITLNINSKGAKPIYINGAATSANNHTLPAGSYIAFYDGTAYQFRTDGKLPASITGDAATVGGHTVAVNVPADAKFTDTTYVDATNTAHGLMSVDDKKKLDSITVSDIGTVGADSIRGEKDINVSITDGVATIGHANTAVTPGTTGGTATGTILTNGGKFKIPTVTFDAYGHITATGESELTLPNITTITGNAGSATNATNDANGNKIDTTYVKKAGDTVTNIITFERSSTIADNNPAGIKFKNIQTDNNVTTQNAYIYVYDDHDADANGSNMVIQSAGNVIIGGGESPSAAYTTDLKDSTTENLYLTSDGSIYFYPNAQTYANHKTLYIDGNGDFRGSRWIYATYFNSSAHAETPTADSYIMYANSDGFLRKSSIANIRSIIGLGNYLPLSGGTMTGDILFSNSNTQFRQIRGIAGGNDYWRIGGGATATNAGWMEISTADDGNEPIYVRQYTGVYTTIKRTLTLLDANGDMTTPEAVIVGEHAKMEYNSSTASLDFSFI